MQKSDFSDINEEPVLKPQRITKHIKKSKDFSFSPYVILGFFPFLYSYIKNHFSRISTGYTNKLFPYYTFESEGQLITFQFPGIGAPLTGALLEESISLGGEIFIFFGRCGILKEDISKDTIIIPTSALKDEGTSFHYTATGRYSYPDRHLVSLISKIMKEYKYSSCKGKVWTTDGVYRETPSKIRKVRGKGCIAVDMEASALFTIAKFHKKRIAGFFVPSDYVSLKEWKQFKPDNDIIKPAMMFRLALYVINKFRKERDAEQINKQ